MSISINKMVTLSYILRADEKNGEIIEQTSAESPLKFVFGAGLMLPSFESSLTGLKQGDPFEIFLEAKDAYGEVDEQAIVDLPKDIFIIDGYFDEERFSIGSQIPMQTSAGQRMNGTVLEVDDNSLKMDFNHPLAGVDLFFNGEILEVRDATDDELAALTGCSCGSCGCDSEHDDCSSGGCSSGSCGC
jgi:FKBP-type peptidyl-prolyl cis-trans isomerase SlyD